jgi:ribosome-binding protein aMBF1 (putative translation factor)
MNNHIDESIWDSVTILTKKHTHNKNNPKKKISDTEDITRKNSKKDSQIKNIQLDNATEAAKHKTICKEYSHKIIQGRVAKKWKQKDLAKKINVNVSIINDYECGRAIVNNTILGKIEKQLNIKIRGTK